MSRPSSHTELPPLLWLGSPASAPVAVAAATTHASVSSLTRLLAGSLKLSGRGLVRGDPSKLSVWPVWPLLWGPLVLLLMAVNR